MNWPIPPLVFLAAIVDRATASAETTFANLHLTSSQSTGRACCHRHCSTCSSTFIHHSVDKISECLTLYNCTQVGWGIEHLTMIISHFHQQKKTWVSYEVKPLLSNLNPDYALSPQLRVDRGELSSKCVIMDHLLDSNSQLFHIRHISVL